MSGKIKVEVNIMNISNEYRMHIEALAKRITALELSASSVLPKDIFMKLKFKEFKVTEGNIIEFIETEKASLALNYDIDE